MLERAAALLSESELDVAIEVDLVEALFWNGEADAALARAQSLAERAHELGDRAAELSARIESGLILTLREPEGATDRLAALVAASIPLFEARSDNFTLYRAYRALGQVANMRGQPDTITKEHDRAYEFAQRAGLPHQLVGWRSMGRFYGSTPLDEYLAWVDGQDSNELRNPWVRARRAAAVAMLGRIEEARTALTELRNELAERGALVALASVNAELSVDVEMCAGDAAAAVHFGQTGCRSLEESGNVAWLSTMAGKLARALYADGQLAEAEAWALRSSELGASDDAYTQMVWRQARAKVLAARGVHAEAENLAREAVMIGANNTMKIAEADANADLGEVLATQGKTAEATAAFVHALSLYEKKGSVVQSEVVRRRLHELSKSPS